jgi:hypothetical protein
VAGFFEDSDDAGTCVLLRKLFSFRLYFLILYLIFFTQNKISFENYSLQGHCAV